MTKLLLLLISFLGAEFKIQAATVKWPSGFSVDWIQRDRHAHSTITATYYFSQKEKSLRWDIYEGTNKIFIKLKDPKTSGIYYYFPVTNDNVTVCYYIPLKAVESDIPDTLPDLSGFTFSKNMTVNKSPAEKWILDHKFNHQTVWLQKGDRTTAPVPIRWESETRHLEEHSEFLDHSNFAFEYDNYKAQEPEETAWLIPKNVDCGNAGRTGFDDIIEDYIKYTIIKTSMKGRQSLFGIQDSNQYNIKRKKGIKRVSKFSESTLPFPHTDEDIQLIASQLPEMFDWRNHGAVTSVKDQGMCGSCWAFGVTGAMEGAYFLKNGVLGDMSEQALVDCGWFADSEGFIIGCFGGSYGSAFDWIKNHSGLPWTAEYGEYKAINGRCMLNHVHTHGAIKGFVQVKPDVDAVKVALTQHGPLSVTIATPEVFMKYKNGVIKTVGDPGLPDHGVLLVGYGSLNGDDYWLIKNSWGESWGISGYGLISMENDTLYLLDDVYYPELL